MARSFQLVVFDWEGTIADTLGHILHVVSEEAAALGFGSIDPHLARQSVDLGLVQALRKLLPHLSDKEHESLMQAVQRAMISRSTEICLIPGVLDLIKTLHNEKIPMAIATNKGHHSLLKALAVTQLDAYIKVTRSASNVPAKPCPQMLEEIMAEFDVPASATIMIGDSPTDMEMAKSIQVTALGVDFYHQQETALIAAGALAVFDEYQLVTDFLKLPRMGEKK